MKIIEQIHLKFCKRILKVRNSTPNFMVYGELCTFPLEIRIKLRMISFWVKLVQNEKKLSSILYRLMISLRINYDYDFKWIRYVESIFNETAIGFIFTSQFTYYDKTLVRQILFDKFIQKWFSDMSNASRGQFYSIFKKTFSMENYLLNLSETSRSWITKFRTSNLRLPIETAW